MKKRIVCLAAAAAVCVCALSGCSGKADEAALDALNDRLETVTHTYNSLADVVAEYGNVQQQEEFADAKEDLDEISGEVRKGKLDKDDVNDLMADIAELQTKLNSIDKAVNGNIPEEGAAETVDITDELESAANLLSGVADNIAQNGGDYQKQLITEYQQTVSDFADEAANGLAPDRAKAVVFELDMMKEAAESINERVNEGSAAVSADAVSDELESLATLVSGVSANIMEGDDQLKKDYMTNITEQLLELQEKLSAGELTDAAARDILDGADVVRELVEAIND